MSLPLINISVMNEEHLTIDCELRAVTDASVWLVLPTRYLRLPKSEDPRPPLIDLDGATADGHWHDHVGVWRQHDEHGSRLRILPAGRPDGSYGVLTGVVVSLTGR